MNFYKKDPNYFLNYFKGNIFVFSLGVALLLLVKENVFAWNFSLISLGLLPVGIIFGLIVATAFHNASHGNIKPRTLNTIIGEFCGAYTLDGMRNFRVGHMLHHIHADDPDHDPHPPQGLTFLEFIKTSKDRTIEVLINVYYKNHGETEESKKNIELQIKTYKIGVLLKIAFWFLLFGPVGFVLFFVPSYLSYFFGFAHLNYISHQPDESGEVVVKNHKGGAFFNIMNIITSGGYYHKNHHLYPSYYNPSKVRVKEEKPATSFLIID